MNSIVDLRMKLLAHEFICRLMIEPTHEFIHCLVGGFVVPRIYS